MYHYVRNGSADFPWFRYLRTENFTKQIDAFSECHTFVSANDVAQSILNGVPIENSIVLTFDDGLKDHYHVAEILESRGVSGIFYVPTGNYQNNKLLDVHRVHMLIGKYGGARILKELRAHLSDDMIQQEFVDMFRNVTYRQQDNDAATKQVKQILNYFVSYAHKQTILDALMSSLFENEADICNAFYLSAQDINEMVEMGMVFGAHSVSHPVLSRLNNAEQECEIVDSFSYLGRLAGQFKTKTFCYPYGGEHSFNTDTWRILDRENVVFSFSVDQRDISSKDLIERPHALPRYDCNRFAFGQASMGVDS